MGGREGGYLLDPTKGLTPGGAARAREKFKKQVKESEERIRRLKQKREQVCANLDELIAREETYIQEAYLVLHMIEDSFGEDQDELETGDPLPFRDDDIAIVKKVVEDPDGKYEITLYGAPYY